ncbi:MAG: hypothetical protein FVQ80_00820 [Planctomycetes bacterium]|nr:hypothetical protein [Planctomycetota bacterium]
MAKQDSPKKDRFLSMLIRNREGFPWHLFSFLLLVSILPYLGAAIDKSFFLPGKAVGIFEHYGNICFTIVCPLIFIFGTRGIRCFDQFVRNVNTNLIEDKFKKTIKLEEFLQTNWNANPYILLKFLLIFSGFVFATVNAINTLRPRGIWGHDVYDSISYVGGYISQRIFFYVWWAYILPVFIYYLFVVVITLNRLFRMVIDTDSLDLQPMHPDNAGGLGELGRMALNFNITILLTMAITITLYYTHGHNTPLTCGIIVQFLLLPVVFFLPLLQVHRAMRIKKESLLLEISKHYKCVSDVLVQKIAKDDKVKEEYEEESNLRALYKSLEDIPTWPFDTRTIMQFTSTILLPALIWLIRGLKTLLQNT